MALSEQKNIIRAKLIEVVKSPAAKIYYFDLLEDLRTEYDLDIDLDTLIPILDEINVEERANHRPLLSAVVIREDDKAPGEGFFNKAIDNGWCSKYRYINFSDFFERQISALKECWIE